MWILCLLLLVELFTVSAYGQNDVRRPPSITINPRSEIIFREFQSITLACKAEGTPPLTYAWKRDGKKLIFNPNFRRESDGYITIINATPQDDGFYQCFATNQYGTALSTVLHIQRAFLQDAPPSNIVNITVQEGHPFVIPAARRISFPTPIYSWDVVTSTVDPTPRSYTFTPRVRNACNGDLYVAYALKEDELNGSIYKNIVFNSATDVRSTGSYTRVMVTKDSESPPDFPPNITYFSMSQEVALVGREFQLKCFFSGKPLPEITWSRPGISLPFGRHSIPDSHFNALLNISNITESDEGNYVCTANNTLGRIQHTHNIRVGAVPIFKAESDGPRNVNVTEGDSITFNCSAFAKPNATVVWLRNGNQINVKKANKGFAFSNDAKSLTIRDVCRDCFDRKTDLMVIQCNASNIHGYAFASGYLNVLLRTKVTLQPSSTFVSVDLTMENRFQFNCSATSDPSTPLTVQWYKDDERGTELVYNDMPYIQVMNGSLTIFTEPNCSTACEKYLGEYRCIGDNGYNQDTVTVVLNGRPTGTIGYEWIWITVGVACILLVLIGSICAVVRQTHHKGAKHCNTAREAKERHAASGTELSCGLYDTIDDDQYASLESAPNTPTPSPHITTSAEQGGGGNSRLSRGQQPTLGSVSAKVSNPSTASDADTQTESTEVECRCGQSGIGPINQQAKGNYMLLKDRNLSASSTYAELQLS